MLPARTPQVSTASGVTFRQYNEMYMAADEREDICMYMYIHVSFANVYSRKGKGRDVGTSEKKGDVWR